MKTSLASLEEILGFSNRPISEGDIPEAIQELENTQEAWKVVETPGHRYRLRRLLIFLAA